MPLTRRREDVISSTQVVGLLMVTVCMKCGLIVRKANHYNYIVHAMKMHCYRYYFYLRL